MIEWWWLIPAALVIPVTVGALYGGLSLIGWLRGYVARDCLICGYVMGGWLGDPRHSPIRDRRYKVIARSIWHDWRVARTPAHRAATVVWRTEHHRDPVTGERITA